AVFLCPKRERNRSKVIRFRNGISVFRQIDRAQVVFAGVAALDANVRKLFRHKHRQFVLTLFATGGTENSSEDPFIRTKRTVQKPSSAITFRLEHTEQGKGIALWANVWRPFDCRLRDRFADKFSVGLQKSAREKFFQRAALLAGLGNAVF